MGKKEIGRSRVAIIGVGFVLGVLLLLFGGGENEKRQVVSGDAAQYRSLVESEITELCENMLGERADVFISLGSGYGYSYALDSRGGVMTVGSGSSESALVERVDMPEISGVGVVYFGEQTPEIERRLVELISSSLGVGSNKIFIIGAKKPTSQS